MECIFCKIVERKEPASFVYEDDRAVGFLNYRPVHPGECLVIPKKHIDHFTDIDSDLALHIFSIGMKIADRIREQLNPRRVGFVVAGYGVAHAHLIVIPQYHANDITCQHFAVLRDGEITFTDKHIPIVSRKELDEVAGKLKIQAE